MKWRTMMKTTLYSKITMLLMALTLLGPGSLYAKPSHSNPSKHTDRQKNGDVRKNRRPSRQYHKQKRSPKYRAPQKKYGHQHRWKKRSTSYRRYHQPRRARYSKRTHRRPFFKRHRHHRPHRSSISFWINL